MKKATILALAIGCFTAVFLQLSACNSDNTVMPKNDVQNGDVDMQMDSGGGDVYKPDVPYNPCDKGIKYDNTQIPGWPNPPMP